MQLLQAYSTVMDIQTNNHNIAAMQYQMQLLKERNRLLSLQNEQLLSELSQANNNYAMLQNKITCQQNKMNCILKVSEKEKIQLARLVSLIQRNCVIGDAHFAKQLIHNSCSTSSIIQNLCDALMKVEAQQNKENKSKGNLDRLQKLVDRRKQKVQDKKIKGKDVIHIVKEPNWKNLYQNQDGLQYIVNCAYKIVTRVKRNDIAIQTIHNLFSQLKKHIQLKKLIREHVHNLNMQQRQIQLGVGCGILHQELSHALLALQQQQLMLKKSIELKINAL